MAEFRDRPREVAFALLRAVHGEQAYANLLLPKLISDARLDARDAALVTEIAYGTLRATGSLDAVIAHCARRDPASLEPGVLDLLRLGTYQALRTRIPAHAAVATTVSLARATGHGRASGLVNAVLRRVVEDDWDRWMTRLAGNDADLRLALVTAHPGWIVAAFGEALSKDGTQTAELEAALRADDERPQTHLVAWPGLIGRDELAESCGGTAGPWSPYAVRLSGGGDPGAIAAVRDGRAAVQDEGSQLCAIALATAVVDGPDARWLDLCAGPGGKTAMLAGLAVGRGAVVTANELHPHRAELVRQATRGRPVEVLVGDAREITEGGYDRVLLDAPCSGLGALRRRPEARWRRDLGDVAELAALQGDLLRAALRLVRPGGVVGYVTCSPVLAETAGVLAAVTAEGPPFAIEDARPLFGGVPELGDGPTVQLWPHRQGTDAMFFASLRRL